MTTRNDTSPQGFRMPAEWEPHDATWIGWPHATPEDWPGKLEAVQWAYTDIVRVIGRHERVEILCLDESRLELTRYQLDRSHCDRSWYRLHVVPTDRTWLRDSGATCVRKPDGSLAWIDWRFNGWAQYDNHKLDDRVPLAMETITGIERIEAQRPDGRGRLVLEGGSIETDGRGTLIVTEECFLTDTQVRNPGMDRAAYERVFAEYLGTRQTIWLDSGVAGDDTHGHVDDVARFVAPGTVVLAYEEDPAEKNHAMSVENLRRLESETDAEGQPFRVLKLPMPAPVYYAGDRLPASYANYYIANGVVIVPMFNDPNDLVAMNILSGLFPDREVIGLASRDLIVGLGALHCLTQQQPSVV